MIFPPASKRRLHRIFVLLLAIPAVLSLDAQTSKPAQAASIEHGIALVESGRCAEALPLLKRLLPTAAGKEQKYHAEMAIARCAMALDQEQAAADALLQLKRESPDDPEVLYIATHYFSELGMRAAKQLQAVAPASYQEQRLEAETLESQGKGDEAAVIYNKILEANPRIPGIHYHLGQIALDRAGASGSTDDAKREFQKEIEVDPSNASAEFVLGELARRAAEWDEAIRRFTRATKLDAGFSEAYLALGMSLTAADKYALATAPLESYVKMQPEDPAGHYQLAIAYSRIGNREGAAREMALQQQAANRAKSATDTLEGHTVHP